MPEGSASSCFYKQTHNMKRIIIAVAAAIVALSSCSKKITILTYNVGAFSKYQENTVPEVATIIKELGASIVSLNELDSVNRRHPTYQAQELARELGGWDFLFASAFPYAGGAYGNAIVSRKKFVQSFRIALPQKDGYEPRSVAMVETEDLIFLSTHLDVGSENARVIQASLINSMVEGSFKGCKKPVILCGDMNAEPGSKAILELQKDWVMLSPAQPTYPSKGPKKCIDYIFHYKDSAPVKVVQAGAVMRSVHTDISKTSDHIPVMAQLRYR